MSASDERGVMAYSPNDLTDEAGEAVGRATDLDHVGVSLGCDTGPECRPDRERFLTAIGETLTWTDAAAIFVLHLDQYDDIYDTFGSAAGERLLSEVGHRLRVVTQSRGDAVYLQGAEFGLLLPGVGTEQQALEVFDDVVATLRVPIDLEHVPVATGATAGLAFAPEHGQNPVLLLQRAGTAMCSAKTVRTPVAVYSEDQETAVQRRLELGGELARALVGGSQLSVVYQPIADMSSGEVVRLEALARWDHPRFGAVPVDEFISIAERTGLIGQLTRLVLERGLRDLAAWLSEGVEVGLSVNLSALDLWDVGLPRFIELALKRHEVSPVYLTLELTETETIVDLAQAGRALKQLAATGSRLAVDDFGSGHSSLPYLHQLPIDEAKIDKSFVTSLGKTKSHRVTVRSAIEIAHSLGLNVVAEGVEDSAACKLLASMGCDAVQGYYLSAPRGRDEIVAWLKTGGRLEYETGPFALRSVRPVAS